MRWVLTVVCVSGLCLGQAVYSDAYGRSRDRKIDDVIEPGQRVVPVRPRYDARGKKHGKWTYRFVGAKTVYARGRYAHGVVTGTWVWYYKNGQLKRRVGFKDAMVHGAWTDWSERGVIRNYTQQKMGKFVGLSKYARNPRRKGRLTTHRQITPANFEEGHIKRYKNGILNGVVKRWSVKNDYRETMYDMGDRHGPHVARYLNRYKQVKAKGRYRDDKRDGSWTFWSAPCGDMKWTGRFVGDVPDGVWALWVFDVKTRKYVQTKTQTYHASAHKRRRKVFQLPWVSGTPQAKASCVRLSKKRSR